jgi:hypothetical protein
MAANFSAIGRARGSDGLVFLGIEWRVENDAVLLGAGLRRQGG